MRNLVKYMFLLGVIAAFFYAAGKFDPSSKIVLPPGQSIGDIGLSFSTSSQNHDYDFSSQTTLAGSGNIEEHARRAENGRRHNLHLDRSFRFTATNFGIFTHSREVVIRTSVTEHIHKLIFLGKLII